MIIYGITLVPLAEDLQTVDQVPISPFYEYGAAFDGYTSTSVRTNNLLLDQGPDQEYFPEISKSLFIAISTA